MSIIADALNRLQSVRAGSGEGISPPVPPQHSQPVPRRWLVLIILVGMVGIGASVYGFGVLTVPDVPAKEVIVVASRESADPPQPVVVTATDAEPVVETEPLVELSVPEPVEETDQMTEEITVTTASEVVALSDESQPSGPSPEDELPTELAVMPPVDTPEPESDLQSRYAKARTFLSARLYAKTIEALSPVFHSPPNEWQPWYLMATAALGLGHLDDSEHYVIEGLARDGSIPQLWVQRALIAQQRGNHDLALHALGQAARLEPDLPEIHLNMAYSFEAQGKIDRATAHYRKFLALTEHNAAYHMVRKKVLTRVMQMSIPAPSGMASLSS